MSSDPLGKVRERVNSALMGASDKWKERFPPSSRRSSVAEAPAKSMEVAAAASIENLAAVLAQHAQEWKYSDAHTEALRKARELVGKEGSLQVDNDLFDFGLVVGAVNEFGVEQRRVLLLSPTACYRVAEAKSVTIPLEKVKQVSVGPTQQSKYALRLTVSEPADGAPVFRRFTSKQVVEDGWYDTNREYRSYTTEPPATEEAGAAEVIETFAHALAKAAALLAASTGGFEAPTVTRV